MSQGTIKDYDIGSRHGSLLLDDHTEVDIDPESTEGSGLRYLRVGQRVVFDTNDQGLATRLRLGSEADMGIPPDPPMPAR